MRPAKEKLAERKKPKLRIGSPKMLDKSIRKAMRMPEPPKNPYAALMHPMVIVPDKADDKVIIADAGSIVRLMNQATLYRDWVSPITRRADELLVQYGKPGKAKLGWISQREPSWLKPSKGPTFLVTTRAEDEMIAWEQIRLKIARMRKAHPDRPTNWIAPWLVEHGPKHQPLLREVTRYFGGKSIKNEPFSERCTRLFSLILKVELTEANVATTKKSSKKTKTTKKQKTEQTEKPTKRNKKQKADKKAKKSAAKNGDRITKDHNEYVIKRLIKENPRRAGSAKAKVWDKLKKGMTVEEFISKGGSRGAVRLYVQNGWVKLLAPSS